MLGRNAWLVMLPALLTTVAALADEVARDLLRQMSQASQALNYRGTFVYQHNGQLEAVRVIHRAVDGTEQERLIALTGEAREVIRNQERVTCILPKSKAVMVDRSVPRKPFNAALPQDLDTLNKHYEFLAMGEDRVSGMPSKIVAIRPRDTFRYGYRLWLEQNSSLLLRSDLVDADGQAIEQMMYTEMQILPGPIAAEEVEPALQGEDYTWLGHNASDSGERPEPAAPSAWKVAWLPAGFSLTHRNMHNMNADPTPVEHLVFSDGLATVSVYIEPRRAGSLSGTTRMGAIHAVGTQVGDYQVTVVGEVPRQTVERIGKSVQRQP